MFFEEKRLIRCFEGLRLVLMLGRLLSVNVSNRFEKPTILLNQWMNVIIEKIEHFIAFGQTRIVHV